MYAIIIDDHYTKNSYLYNNTIYDDFDLADALTRKINEDTPHFILAWVKPFDRPDNSNEKEILEDNLPAIIPKPLEIFAP